MLANTTRAAIKKGFDGADCAANFGDCSWHAPDERDQCASRCMDEDDGRVWKEEAVGMDVEFGGASENGHPLG
ncbi:hypothetical protein, partial [Bradyrhizobium ottawaense]|uniref:hypothetical protein n=1 Tax=Bradyrhizobium ottawaense TaxID=931866 RepID=UPI0030C70E88